MRLHALRNSLSKSLSLFLVVALAACFFPMPNAWATGEDSNNDAARSSGGLTVVQASMGNEHTGYLLSDGTLWTCGSNEYGQLGTGTTVDKSVPVKVMSGVESMQFCGVNSMALKTDGTLWTWGKNSYGQIGDGTTDDALRPKKVMDDVVAFDIGGNYGDVCAAVK